MSAIKLSVAIISNQKKNEYLKSSVTIELISISVVNKINDTINALWKNGSDGFVVAHTLISS